MITKWLDRLIFRIALAVGGIRLAMAGLAEMQEAEYDEELINQHW